MEDSKHSSSSHSCSVCYDAKANCSIDGCEHLFCLKCIRRWAKKKNTCPLCRQRFLAIHSARRTYKITPPPQPASRRAPLPLPRRQRNQVQPASVVVVLPMMPPGACIFRMDGRGPVLGAPPIPPPPMMFPMPYGPGGFPMGGLPFYLPPA